MDVFFFPFLECGGLGIWGSFCEWGKVVGGVVGGCSWHTNVLGKE
uniref:Uncharacterized protein n=1 Tax=Rhizophora mucronata TaxID=61149 RepID=A0A2P2IT47_RHIMU